MQGPAETLTAVSVKIRNCPDGFRVEENYILKYGRYIYKNRKP